MDADDRFRRLEVCLLGTAQPGNGTGQHRARAAVGDEDAVLFETLESSAHEL
jgi:hypothetical protein